MESTAKTFNRTVHQAVPLDPEHPATMLASWPARVVGPIEEMDWLDRVGNEIMRWLQPVLDQPGASRVKDVLHGRQLGHALHPVLTELPIGFWTSAAVLDLFGARLSSRLLNACGCVSAVGAAATGFADWTVTGGRERRLGLFHGLLNVGGLACQLVALTSRRSRRRSWSWAGLTISTAAAYLGGELVFGRGLMVDRNAWTAGPREWTAVMPEADLLEGSMKPVEVEGRTVLLTRERGQINALEGRCGHAGGPLHEGTLKAGVVTCPWHGSQFDVTDGFCVRGPATFPQPRLEARVRGGRIQVRGRQG